MYSDLFIVIQYDRELHKSPGASSEFRKLFFLSTWSVSFDIKKSIDFHASVNSCSSSYQTVSAQVKSSPPVTRNTPPLSIHNKLLVSTFSSVPIWAHFQTEWELYSPTYLLHVVNTSACRSKVFYFSCSRLTAPHHNTQLCVQSTDLLRHMDSGFIHCGWKEVTSLTASEQRTWSYGTNTRLSRSTSTNTSKDKWNDSPADLRVHKPSARLFNLLQPLLVIDVRTARTQMRAIYWNALKCN